MRWKLSFCCEILAARRSPTSKLSSWLVAFDMLCLNNLISCKPAINTPRIQDTYTPAKPETKEFLSKTESLVVICHEAA